MTLTAQSVSRLSPVILHQSVCEVVSYPFTIFACLMSHCIHSSSLIIRTIFQWPHPRCPIHCRWFSDSGLCPVPKNIQLKYHQKTPKQVTLLLLTSQCSVPSSVLGHHLCLKASTNYVLVFNSIFLMVCISYPFVQYLAYPQSPILCLFSLSPLIKW